MRRNHGIFCSDHWPSLETAWLKMIKVCIWVLHSAFCVILFHIKGVAFPKVLSLLFSKPLHIVTHFVFLQIKNFMLHFQSNKSIFLRVKIYRTILFKINKACRTKKTEKKKEKRTKIKKKKTKTNTQNLENKIENRLPKNYARR